MVGDFLKVFSVTENRHRFKEIVNLLLACLFIEDLAKYIDVALCCLNEFSQWFSGYSVYFID